VRHRACIIAVVCCTLAAVVYADYRDAFRRGVQGFRQSRWPVVIGAMKEALAERGDNPRERINISGFGDIVPYVPSFYLGVALYRTGDCSGALSAWNALEASGIDPPDRGLYAKARKECEARVAAAKPSTPTPPAKPAGPDPAAVNAAAQTAEAAIGRAQDADSRLTSFANDSVLRLAWGSESNLGPAAQRARDTLGRARSELDAGRREPSLQRLQEAANLAAAATQAFDAVRQAAENRRAQLAVPPPIKEDKPAANPGTTATPPKPGPTVTPPRPEPPPPTTPTTTPATPSAQPFTPPAPLAQAARLFFSARYQEAAASLSVLRYDSGLAAGHAALLRAATQYSLYLIGGEKDTKLVEQARQSIREVRRVAPALQPDPRAFSPRFVAFFNQTR
jgi:hypothetical protein